VSIRRKISDFWRKNSPELVAWWNDALPAFVTARHPIEPLGGVPVFCFHLVDHDTFEADLRFLQRNNYRTLSAGEFLRYLDGTMAVGPRAVLLTFDDGPRNFYDVAFPLLQKYGAKAVAFIAPGLHADREPTETTERPMTWQEVEAIAASGLVDIQSHTYESRYVPRWPMPVPLAGCSAALENSRRREPVSLEQDLRDSRVAILRRLPGRSVEHLAFPMYVGTDEATHVAASLGFKACYWGAVKGRPLNRPGDSPRTVSRLSDEFVRRLPGEGRVGIGYLLRERVRRARSARAWRRRYAS
jgi:peptidoglycan/xylan/chitin deacetylase (PgdA/CDA1 family)